MQEMSYQNSHAQAIQPDKKEDAPVSKIALHKIAFPTMTRFLYGAQGTQFRQKVLFAYVLLVGSFAAAVIGIIANGPWTR